MSSTIVRRAVSCLMLVLLLPSATACTSWRNHQLSPSPGSATSHSGLVRVTKLDGSFTLVENAQLRGDTLVAQLAKGSRDVDGVSTQGVTIHVPTRDVTRLERKRFSVGKTLGLVGGTYLTVLAVAFIGYQAASRSNGGGFFDK